MPSDETWDFVAACGSLPGGNQPILDYLSPEPSCSDSENLTFFAFRPDDFPDVLVLLADTAPFLITETQINVLYSLLPVLRDYHAMEQRFTALRQEKERIQKRWEQSRQPSKTHQAHLFTNASVGLFQVTPDGSYIHANQRLADLLGYDTVDALMEDSLLRPECRHPVPAEATGTEPIQRERTLLRRDGTARYIFESFSAVRNRHATIVYFEGTMIDMTARRETESALEHSETLLRTVLESATDAIFVKDRTGTYQLINSAGARMMGYRVEEIIGSTDAELTSPADVAMIAEQDRAIFEQGVSITYERTGGLGKPADDSRTFLTTKDPFRDRNGNIIGLVGIGREITDRRRIERAQQEYQARFEHAFHNAGIGMALFDLNGVFLEVNAPLCRILGRESVALVGQSLVHVTHPDDAAECANLIASCTPSFQREKRFVHADGRVVRGFVTASLVHDGDGNPLYYIGQMQDISEQWEAEQRLRWQAYHDVLTEIPNRFRFEEALNAALTQAIQHETDGGVSVLLLDLDRFKRINDTLGHLAGDQLLQEAARRLRVHLPAEAMLARMGGDEFTVLLTGFPSDVSRTAWRHRTAEAADKLLAALAAPFVIAGQELFLSASVGIAVYPKDGRDAPTLMKHADIAMYRAKERSRGSSQFYTRAMSETVQDIRLEAELQRAIERGEMKLVYQPQMTLTNPRIIGIEALLRWHHPTQGVLRPGHFIAMAEDSGVILQLGEWAIREACRLAKTLQQNGGPLPVAVNLSARQFAQTDIVPHITAILEQVALPPHLLELEITETTLMENGTSALDRMRALKELGVRLSVDDFGTGYSSLSYLRYLPLDVLKIDRSFIVNLPEDPQGHAVVRALIEMAHSLGIYVIAEGVENEQQRRILEEMRCDALQGFLYGEAVPFEHLLSRFTASPSPSLPHHSLR